MKIKDTISQMQEVIQYLINHKDNQPDTDFCKNVDKLINLKADLVNGAEKSEANLNIANVVGSLPITKTCFFELKNKKYIAENGTEITTEILTKYRHSIMGNYGFIVLD